MVNTVPDPIGDPLTRTTPGDFQREYSLSHSENSNQTGTIGGIFS